MSDYESLIERKITQISSDRAEMRQVVYEAARLALRQQLHTQRPAYSSTEIRHHLIALETAIGRIEARSLDNSALPAPLDTFGEVARDVAASRTAAVPWEPEPAPTQALEVVVMPQAPAARPRSSYGAGTEVSSPTRFGGAYEMVSATTRPRLGKALLSGFAIMLQLVVASFAGAMIYAALSGRVPPLPSAGTLGAILGPKPTAATGLPSPPAVEAIAAARQELSRAMAQPTTISSVPEFPFPTSYGIYAVSNGRLINLAPAQTLPFDQRFRSVLQTTDPAHTVIDDPKPSFLIYRRDMVANAPDKVVIRIAARIGKTMTFDANGKPVVAPPSTESWLIRDKGYDLRVSPVPENQEMVWARPEDPTFSFPPGRYELLLSGQPYDFVIAGTVSDPAQCVEDVMTGRGPVFYECKTQ